MPKQTDDFYEDYEHNDFNTEFEEDFFDYVLVNNYWKEWEEDPSGLYHDYILETAGIGGLYNEINREEELAKRGFTSDEHQYFDMGCSFESMKDIEFEETNDYVIFPSPHCFNNLYEYCREKYPTYVKELDYEALTINHVYLKYKKEEGFNSIDTKDTIVNSKNFKEYYRKHVEKYGLIKNPAKQDFTVNTKRFNSYLKMHKRIVGKSKESTTICAIYDVSKAKRHNNTKKTYPYVLLCYLEQRFVHCVLIKNNYKGLIKLKFKERHVMLSEDDEYGQYPMEKFVFKDPKDKIIVYDIEATNERGKAHIPIAITAYELELPKSEDDKFKVDESKKKKYVAETLKGCYDLFMLDLKNYDATQLFAHNGGGYDNYFIFQSVIVKLQSDNFVSSKFKKITFKLHEIFDDERVYTLKDSLSFFPRSLIKFNKATKNKHYVKQKYDCSLITFDSLKDPLFHEYLDYDTMALSESLFELEKWLRKLDLSITTYIGCPGMAVGLFRHRYCYRMLMCPKSYNVRLFMRQSVYGGRVLHHYKKPFAHEKLISLDCNSLYPTALLYKYPIDKYSVTKKGDLNIEFIKKYLGIYEVIMDGGNVRYGIIPWREGLKTLVTYPGNVFRGVYNTIDIISAINAGYEIKEIIQGIHWKKSGSCFKEFIEFLYKERKRLKKEENPAEVMYKLLMVSFFGKFLENNNKVSTYKDPGFKCLKRKIASGQTRYSYSVFPTTKYPLQIGSFVLSYARAIMNKLFEKIKVSDVVYMDTDSAYINKDLSYLVPQSGELGDFKNDYGDGTYIEDFLITDYKRYFLKFNKPIYDDDKEKMITSKTKWNGLRQTTDTLKFENDGLAKEFIIDFDKDESVKSFVERTMSGKIKVSQEKWKRSVEEGIIIDMKQLEFLSTSENRRIWKEDNDSYPKDYNFDKEERVIVYKDFLKMGEKYLQCIDHKKSYEMSKPLKANKNVFCDKPISNIIISNKKLIRIDNLDKKKGVDISKRGENRCVILELDKIEKYVLALKSEFPEIDEDKLNKIVDMLVRKIDAGLI